MYGVDPEFGRKIDVDLSEERMKRSWEAYKIRWEREEERRRELEEKKLEFRILLDKKREMYEYLTDEEKAQFKESLRLFRHPQFSRKSGMFYTTSGISNENDNTSAENAFTRKNTNTQDNISRSNNVGSDHMSERDIIQENKKITSERDHQDPSNDSFCDNLNTESSKFPHRRNSFKQDTLSNNRKNGKNELERNFDVNAHIHSDRISHEAKDTAEKFKIRSNKEKHSNDDIDDILTSMNKPNPKTAHSTRSGTGAHFHAETLRRESMERTKKYEALKSEDGPPQTAEFEGLIDENYIDQQNLDPMMMKKGTLSNDNTSYFSKWTQNIKEAAANKQNRETDDRILEGSPSHSKSTVIVSLLLLSILSFLAYTVVLDNGYDVPVNKKSNEVSSKEK
jgi:hypothetical protein